MTSAARPEVLVCFGTRPEVVKLAPVVAALRARAGLATASLSVGQHHDMLARALHDVGLRPHEELGLMRPGQGLAELAGRAVAAVGAVLARRRPAAVLVQGDTTTAFCAALAAFYAGIAVGHVEAGLRTGTPREPFPEEAHRRLIAPLTRWHFCPTAGAARHLLAEGVAPEEVFVTGNTVVDALLATAARPLPAVEAVLLPPRARPLRILVTLHRRETQGAAQAALCRELARVARRGDVEILLPVHRSPAVRAVVERELGGVQDVHLLEPLPHGAFVHALRSADLVVTDSGGVQEEAPALDVPVLVVRETTERPEGVRAGCARLSGTRPDAVGRDVELLLDDSGLRARMARAPSPYGDGRAAERIADRLSADLAPVSDGLGPPLTPGAAPPARPASPRPSALALPADSSIDARRPTLHRSRTPS